MVVSFTTSTEEVSTEVASVVSTTEVEPHPIRKKDKIIKIIINLICLVFYLGVIIPGT